MKDVNISKELYYLAYEVKKYNNVEDFISYCKPYFDRIGQLNFKYKMYNWITKEFMNYVDTVGSICKNSFYDTYKDFEEFYNIVKEIELIPQNQNVANDLNKDFERWLTIPANINDSTDIKDYIKYAEIDDNYMDKCKLVIVNNKFAISEPITL